MNTSVDEVGQEAVQYLDKLGEMKTTPGGAEEFLDYKNLTPVYFFKRFGTAGEKIFNTLKDGWSKLAFNSKEIIDFAKTLYSTEEVRDAEKNVIELQLHRRVNENENSEALGTDHESVWLEPERTGSDAFTRSGYTHKRYQACREESAAPRRQLPADNGRTHGYLQRASDEPRPGNCARHAEIHEHGVR